jgi:hypothetical protein
MNQIREWNGVCQRCFNPSELHTMSMFDVALICLNCSSGEKSHPEYKNAAEAEAEAVKRGNLNFAGTGCPPELKELLPGMEWELE